MDVIYSYRTIFPLIAGLMLGGCTSVRMGDAAAPWWPSPNFEARRANYVILHHTSNDMLEQALWGLTSPFSGVSSHYLIGRDGRVLQLVREADRAWHAGVSRWGGQTDMNSASIGIELDNNGFEPFPDIQIEALLALLADIQARHGIPRANFLGHADIAPARKSDPSAFFPWRRLAAAGFGLWCEPPPDSMPPENFDPLLGLAALGYDVRQPQAAIAAFKLHFLPEEFVAGAADQNAEMSADARARLYCLVRRTMADEAQ
ncbi:MAG: N-acetylmuramoyl-L-alanine amidase [Azoarcus sp.]|jgi:N-acetylmuramoyl-L-alanine amidase|nr:N-acetylmuramoyl-L-alanine amidase [Azoarcus sp.]